MYIKQIIRPRKKWKNSNLLNSKKATTATTRAVVPFQDSQCFPGPLADRLRPLSEYEFPRSSLLNGGNPAGLLRGMINVGALEDRREEPGEDRNC